MARDQSVSGHKEPVGLTENRLQNYLTGPYFTGFLVNSSLLTLQIRRNLSSLS
jgi:hypothetical protein